MNRENYSESMIVDNRQILVVDDDDTFRNRLARGIKERGYSCFQAKTRVEVFEVLARKKIDRVILDLKLEQDSGLSLIPKIMSACPECKIIVLTGYGTIKTTVEALKLGALNYLTKPLDIDHLLRAFELEFSSGSFLFELEDNATPTLSQIEWDYIQRVIESNGGNISRASRALGLHRRSLQRKLAKNPGKIL